MRGVLLRVLEVTLPVIFIALALIAARGVWEPVCVEGGSMRPALYPGDLVLVARASAPRVGDIVLAEVPRRGPVLHRVVSDEGRAGYLLRGDANNVADARPIVRSRIRGVVVRVVPVGALLAKWRRA